MLNKISHRKLLYCIWCLLLLFPFLINPAHTRVGEARMIAAKSEMKTIAGAINMAKLDTGFYVTLRTLDDNPGFGSFKQGTFLDFKIQSEPIPFAINDDGTLLQSSNFPFRNWKGPYINYQNTCTTGNPYTLSEYGSPLDPWLNPYRFFTAKVLTNPSPGDPTTSLFNQPTIVSYGFDGRPGNNGQTQVGTGDDITYQF